MIAHDPPPPFDAAKTKREKVRSAGMDPNHWYAVEQSHNLAVGKSQRVTFWGDHVAIYRDDKGLVHAVEDRCAHRHVPLTFGVVEGDRIRCQYHGWAYDKSGRLADVPHDLFGMKMPQCRIRAFPVRERYGLIWVFFGDAERASTTAMPEIPELEAEGEGRWACVPVDGTWAAHHSMIIDNVSDFTHEFLHRKHKPFADSKLTSLETNERGVFVSYDTHVGAGGLAGKFIDRRRVNTNAMKLGYEYPYQWSNTDDQIKHWLFVLPIDERTTRGFFLFYFKNFKVPFLPVSVPRFLMEPIIKIANRLHIKPLLQEDGDAVEAEQLGWEKHWAAPIAEISPAVHAFQNLTIQRWEDHLKSALPEKKAPNGIAAQPLNRDKRA